jgi:hypothetical protein
MIVDTCWGPRAVIDKPYWHLVPTRGSNAMMFYNSVGVGKGALLSVSAAISAEPHIENAHTPYSFSRLSDGKEEVFERIRKSEFQTHPSRMKSIYLFDDYSLVEKALAEWFQNDPKIVHECRVLVGSTNHTADTARLNCLPIDWEACAKRYWGGLMCDHPFPETIVDGAIYFPEYKSFPDPASFLPKHV